MQLYKRVRSSYSRFISYFEQIIIRGGLVNSLDTLWHLYKTAYLFVGLSIQWSVRQPFRSSGYYFLNMKTHGALLSRLPISGWREEVKVMGQYIRHNSLLGGQNPKPLPTDGQTNGRTYGQAGGMASAIIYYIYNRAGR